MGAELVRDSVLEADSHLPEQAGARGWGPPRTDCQLGVPGILSKVAASGKISTLGVYRPRATAGRRAAAGRFEA